MPPTKHNGIKQNKGEEQDEIRLRSFNSDQNEALLDMIKVETLREMDIVSDDEINKASKQSKNSVQTGIDILNDKLPKLSDKQLSEFEERITNKMATKKAFENQIAGKGFSIVEMLTSCTTNWGISPTESHQWIRDYLIPHYPMGNFRND